MCGSQLEVIGDRFVLYLTGLLIIMVVLEPLVIARSEIGKMFNLICFVSFPLCIYYLLIHTIYIPYTLILPHTAPHTHTSIDQQTFVATTSRW